MVKKVKHYGKQALYHPVFILIYSHLVKLQFLAN